jgi:uncharacterized protein
MLRTAMVRQHCIVGALVLLAAQAGAPASSAAQEPGPVSSFVVFMSGRQLGVEQASVTATPEGWVIRGSGRLGQPISRTTNHFETRYDREWHPLSLEIRVTVRGQLNVTRTTFAGGSATSDITEAGEPSHKVDAVSADPVVLPTGAFFSAFEALALRLRTAAIPSGVRAYIAARGEFPIRVVRSGLERIRTTDRTIAAKRFDLVMDEPGGAVEAELWVDEASRMLRFRVPAQGIEVAREDVSTVTARVEKMGRPNDEEIQVPAYGFNLAGTLSKPAAAPVSLSRRDAKAFALPAVVLVPGPGAVDRDETVAGVSLFAQLANALADAGFAVVRYDKRGIGQSGGRDESATISDYADDARAVVKYLRKRQDIDPRRIALVGHGEGGFGAMLAAADAKDDVVALVLLAVPGTTGADLVMEQQLHILDRLGLPDSEKQARIELQERIHHAAISGQGWDSIPEGYRNQADTAWFRSLLEFDPAKVMAKVRQPVFVLQAERDREVVARHAQLLLDAAKARKKAPPAALVTIDGVNHLLVPAITGETDEYAALPDTNVSPKASGGLVLWLKDLLNVGTAGAGR